MKSKSLKLSTLCLVMMGGYQGVAAQYPNAAAAIIQGCRDSSLYVMPVWPPIKKVSRYLKIRKLKIRPMPGPYLAEWDELHAKARDFGAAVGLYSNVDPDPALRQASR